MSQISNVSREAAVKAFGSVWLAEDFGNRLCEHLGPRKPSLHFGDTFSDLETARLARPGYEVVSLPERISLPNVTPVPRPRVDGRPSHIPREVFVVEFGNLLAEGLRIVAAQIESVEFEIAPAHLLGKVDFVAGAVVAGEGGSYRVMVEYDREFGLNIVENPHLMTERGYVASGQSMAFFDEAEAAGEADKFARSLIDAADWRSRSAVGKTAHAMPVLLARTQALAAE